MTGAGQTLLGTDLSRFVNHVCPWATDSLDLSKLQRLGWRI